MIIYTTFDLVVIVFVVAVMIVMGVSCIRTCYVENKELKVVEKDWARTIIADNQTDVAMTIFMMLYGIGCFISIIASYLRQ